MGAGHYRFQWLDWQRHRWNDRHVDVRAENEFCWRDGPGHWYASLHAVAAQHSCGTAARESATTTFNILIPPLNSPLEDADGLTILTLDPNDDGSAGPVDLGFSINFGGQSYSQLYVNNNGNLTFGTSLSQYTPSTLEDLSLPIIAPFFADVDTRRGCPRPTVQGRSMVRPRLPPPGMTLATMMNTPPPPIPSRWS